MADVLIRDVTKSYGKVQVIHGLNCQIAHGEFAVIVGPSGCGKSTLLRMIAGLERITGGEISIGGEVMNQREPKDRNISMVFQNYALYPHMSVYANMSYGLRVAKVPKAEIDSRVQEAARILQLSDFLDRRPGQLSGGQRQRVAMGRAIVREPAVFLFDEPLSNLDAKLRVQMRIEIRRLHNSLDTTSVYVTHDQVEAMTLADRLIVMNGGNAEQIGTPMEIYGRPATTFVAGFIGSPPMNFLAGKIAADGAGIKLHDGLTMAAADDAMSAMPGREVTLGVRPEHLRLTASPEGAMPMTVDLVEALGADTLVYGQVGQDQIVSRLPHDAPVKLGDRINLSFAATDIHLFDAGTGARLSS